MNRFSIWKDEDSGHYEIVCWTGTKARVVQCNIWTREKAQAALETWRRREQDRVTPSP